MGFLRPEYAAPFNLPNDYDIEFGQYGNMIKGPDGTELDMETLIFIFG